MTNIFTDQFLLADLFFTHEVFNSTWFFIDWKLQTEKGMRTFHIFCSKLTLGCCTFVLTGGFIKIVLGRRRKQEVPWICFSVDTLTPKIIEYPVKIIFVARSSIKVKYKEVRRAKNINRKNYFLKIVSWRNLLP